MLVLKGANPLPDYPHVVVEENVAYIELKSGGLQIFREAHLVADLNWLKQKAENPNTNRMVKT